MGRQCAMDERDLRSTNEGNIGKSENDRIMANIREYNSIYNIGISGKSHLHSNQLSANN